MNMDELFGPEINRSDSDSIKWKRYKNKDVLPMWVADMDFMVAPEILNAIKQRVDHGVLGYGSDSPELRQAIVQHCQIIITGPLNLSGLYLHRVWLRG